MFQYLAIVLLALRIPCPEAAAAGPRTLAVTILGDPTDARVGSVQEAVEFWNRELEAAGAGVRFGTIRVENTAIPDAVLSRLSRAVVGGEGVELPAPIDQVPGDIVVALSGAELMSFAVPCERHGKGFVALRRADVPPLSLPNVARNAAAHELGHVLGLRHNDDPATLMCGRPAPCRPDTYASARDRFFPLTDFEKNHLRELWR